MSRRPYRYIPLFAPGPGTNLSAGAPAAGQRAAPGRAARSTASERDRYAPDRTHRRRVGRASLRLDERLYTDSWGLWASTDAPRDGAGRRWLLWPHLRFHSQSSAVGSGPMDLRRGTARSPAALPAAAIASCRAFDTITGGFGIKLRVTKQPALALVCLLPALMPPTPTS